MQAIFITKATVSEDGESVTVSFHDSIYTFHSQWLHDAQTGDGPYKLLSNVYTQKKGLATIRSATVAGAGIASTLDTSWDDGLASCIPALWLRVHAPLVARNEHVESTAKGAENGVQTQISLDIPPGWLTTTLDMPAISYHDIFPSLSDTTALRIFDMLLSDAHPGILRITDLPPPQLESERLAQDTLVTRVLKKIFGSVFIHPRRGPDISYNASSHFAKDVVKGKLLPNFDTDQHLLPHVDQTFYQRPSRVVGLYALEGTSINTFVSCRAVLRTLREEAPDLVAPLLTVPVTYGRAAHMYEPSQYQGAPHPVALADVDRPGRVWRFNWHPHFVGSLLAPYAAYHGALAAHKKFHEIAERESHKLRVDFKEGDMYLFDNFNIIHGREKVLETPRTSVGQSVPEQVVVDRWREVLTQRLLASAGVEERWLVHVPLPQLSEMNRLMDSVEPH